MQGTTCTSFSTPRLPIHLVHSTGHALCLLLHSLTSSCPAPPFPPLLISSSFRSALPPSPNLRNRGRKSRVGGLRRNGYLCRPLQITTLCLERRNIWRKPNLLVSLHTFPSLGDQAKEKGSYQSGQMGLTVTQLTIVFGGSNPSLPTFLTAEVAQSIEH